ncbi:hypothetical protein FOL47_005568 [Perkinsus chesapeaki]|uniref:Phosphatidylserine synthase 2 n=1 Tax=Perkinsus chesapeaki TaxID=330153 RepID=A0A7J6LWW8_PERCH|nr:hypothetical protein FOL47_005568 [Perkinsus chesapeaki]
MLAALDNIHELFLTLGVPVIGGSAPKDHHAFGQLLRILVQQRCNAAVAALQVRPTSFAVIEQEQQRIVELHSTQDAASSGRWQRSCVFSIGVVFALLMCGCCCRELLDGGTSAWVHEGCRVDVGEDTCTWGKRFVDLFIRLVSDDMPRALRDLGAVPGGVIGREEPKHGDGQGDLQLSDEGAMSPSLVNDLISCMNQRLSPIKEAIQKRPLDTVRLLASARTDEMHRGDAMRCLEEASFLGGISRLHRLIVERLNEVITEDGGLAGVTVIEYPPAIIDALVDQRNLSSAEITTKSFDVSVIDTARCMQEAPEEIVAQYSDRIPPRAVDHFCGVASILLEAYQALVKEVIKMDERSINPSLLHNTSLCWKVLEFAIKYNCAALLLTEDMFEGWAKLAGFLEKRCRKHSQREMLRHSAERAIISTGLFDISGIAYDQLKEGHQLGGTFDGTAYLKGSKGELCPRGTEEASLTRSQAASGIGTNTEDSGAQSDSSSVACSLNSSGLQQRTQTEEDSYLFRSLPALLYLDELSADHSIYRQLFVPRNEQQYSLLARLRGDIGTWEERRLARLRAFITAEDATSDQKHSLKKALVVDEEPAAGTWQVQGSSDMTMSQRLRHRSGPDYSGPNGTSGDRPIRNPMLTPVKATVKASRRLKGSPNASDPVPDLSPDGNARQVAFAIIFFSIVAYVSYRSSLETFDGTDSARAAVGMVFLTVIIYSVLQTRDGLMVRPHPALWRAIHGAILVYMIILVILLGNSISSSPAVHLIYPEIHGGPEAVLANIVDAEPGSHNSLISFDHLHCELTFSHILRSITNIWFAAHVVGYWAKMCLFRDWSMCWMYSFAFELAELGLVWVIPEFQECWWDSLLMDVFGANFLGMCLGRLTLSYLECQTYTWESTGIEGSPKPCRGGQGIGRRLKRAVLQFTPYSWSRYDWPRDASHWVLSQVAWLQCYILELNSFFLIHAFALKPSHIFCPVRQLALAFHGAQAVPEWYEYIKGRTKRIGHNVWLLSCVTVLETIICIRYGNATHHFLTDDTSPPKGDIIAWVVFCCVTLLWLVLYLSLYKSSHLSELPSWLKCLR